MKKEILRIHNLNQEYSSTTKLVDISLCLMLGETVGFLGLVDSGKNLLVDILCGNQWADPANFYFMGKPAANMQQIHKSVYKITHSNYLIDSWTVAEYIGLVSDRSFPGFYRQKNLVNKIDSFIRDLGLTVDAGKRLKHLSGLEKRLIDLAKACSIGAKVLIIEDEFEGCTTLEIKQFKEVLDLVIQDKMVVVINSYSDNVSNILSDKYIIFKKGHIVKKCNKEYIRNTSHLEKFLLETDITSKKKNLDNYKNEQSIPGDVIFRVRSMAVGNGETLELELYRGEMVSILVSDTTNKQQIFDLLSGRLIDKYMDIFLENDPCNFKDITDFVRNKIVSIADMGGKEELLQTLTIEDNLLIPSLDKIPAIQYVFSGHRLFEMLKREIKDNIEEADDTVKQMNTNDNIVLLLERWYIYKPKVLILFEPFVNCDVYSVSLVKSYIKKFTGLGTAVIVVKSREEYIEDISNRIINVG